MVYAIQAIVSDGHADKANQKVLSQPDSSLAPIMRIRWHQRFPMGISGELAIYMKIDRVY